MGDFDPLAASKKALALNSPADVLSAVSTATGDSELSDLGHQVQQSIQQTARDAWTTTEPMSLEPSEGTNPWSTYSSYLTSRTNIKPPPTQYDRQLEYQWILGWIEADDNNKRSEADRKALVELNRRVTDATDRQVQRVTNAAKLVSDRMLLRQQLLQQHLTGQEYIKRTLDTWQTFVDTKLAEQTTLNDRLNGLAATQNRESVFTLDDVQSLSGWKRGVNMLFVVLLTGVVLVFGVQYVRLALMKKNLVN